jgi:hypothetical protein
VEVVLVFLIVFGLVAAVGKFWLLFVSPQAYMQQKQHDHDLKMARRERNKQLFSVASRFFLR